MSDYKRQRAPKKLIPKSLRMCGSGSNRHEFKAEEGSLLFESLKVSLFVFEFATVRTMLTHGLEPSAQVARRSRLTASCAHEVRSW